MQLLGNQFVACPMPINPLYREQSEIYILCKPLLYRGIWTKEQSFERLIQLNDFKAVLQDNPQIKDLVQGELVVNYEALAQHYGIATNMMDMTNSLLVTAFFATTKYDPVADDYHQILHTISKGIIYFSLTGDLLNFSKRNRIWPTGQEALKRPGEQRAFAMVMENNSDFDMQYFTFWHNPESLLKVWELTQGGKLLFPFDPMAEKVRIMKKYKIYSLEGLRTAYESNKDFAETFEEARQIMENNECTFMNHLPFPYTKDEINYITDIYHKMYPDSFGVKYYWSLEIFNMITLKRVKRLQGLTETSEKRIPKQKMTHTNAEKTIDNDEVFA